MRVTPGTVGTFCLRLSTVATAFVTSVLLARLLGTEGYGLFAYVMAWVGLLVIPAMLGLDRLVVKEMAAAKAREEWGLVRGMASWSRRMVLGLSLALSAAAIGVVMVAGGENTRLVFVAAILALPFSALSGIYQAAVRGLGFVVSGQVPDTLVRALGFLVLIGAFYLAFGSITPAAAAGLYSGATFAALFCGVLFWRFRRPVEVRTVERESRGREWFVAALPLVFVAGMQVVNNRTDTIMLGALEGTDSAGIYWVACRVAEFVTFALMVVNFPLAPAAAALFAKGENEELQALVTRSARLILLGTLPVVVLIVALGRFLLSLYGEGFEPGYTALVILAAGQLVNAAAGPVGLLLNMTGHQKDTAMGLGISALINVTLNAVLIPAYGIEGAAIATAVSLVAWNVILYVRVRQRLGIRPTAI